MSETEITLTNDLHNTKVTIGVPCGGRITQAQLDAARTVLCGMADCSCGGDASERGEQEHGATVVQLPEGGALVEWEVEELCWLVDRTSWDRRERLLTPAELTAACDLAENYCTEHEGSFLSIRVAPAGDQEPGVYRDIDGDDAAPVPLPDQSVSEQARKLLGAAWVHVDNNWPAATEEVA